MNQIKYILEKVLAENPHLKNLLTQGLFGLERENLRITTDGQIAQTDHPSTLGSKLIHPYITTDFSESQPELISPPLPSISKMLGFVDTLHNIFSQNIGDELIWPHSLPPTNRNKKARVADFGEVGKEKTVYRNYLLSRYGEQRMLMCGIHFNLSFPDHVLESLGGSEKVYFKVLRNFIRYRWMLIWLYGCSPYVAEGPAKSIEGSDGNECGEKSASIRNSKEGYKNKHDIYIKYESLQEYTESIQKYIDEDIIYSEAELYTPIRIKRNLEDKCSHLELRIFDLYPYNKTNILPESMYFGHLFILFCLFEPETQPWLTYEEHQIANANSDHASCSGTLQFSLQNFDGSKSNVTENLELMVTKVNNIVENLDFINIEKYSHSLEMAKYWIKHPEERMLIKLRKDVAKEGFMEFCLNKAKLYKIESSRQSFKFNGFEDLELSTQLLLQAALLKGINFEILDFQENFVHLYLNGHDEYVVQATKTSLDKFSSILIMENKVVTKKVLAKSKIRVPSGEEYYNIHDAIKSFFKYKGKAIVIKPKSTNFGIGISIFKSDFSEQEYTNAINLAFKYDSAILVEEFISGKEYRFFVLNNEVVGVLHRVPANVIGNGKDSITSLVNQKNNDPLRSKGYKTPLELIQLGDQEKQFLSFQGLNFEYIPKLNEVIYLRENSNISTGGDSIDFTDITNSSYCEIAIRAAKAANVVITGIDIMIDNISEVATETNYAIIEMNFNPAIHIHCYPFKGVNRKINEKLIELLFPETKHDNLEI